MRHLFENISESMTSGFAAFAAHLANIFAKSELNAAKLVAFHEIAVLVQKIIDPHFLENNGCLPGGAGGALHPFHRLKSKNGIDSPTVTYNEALSSDEIILIAIRQKPS